MTSPQDLKDIIVSIIKEADDIDIINIANQCLKNQKVIDHVIYMINNNNYKIIDDYYTEYKLCNNDNQLSIKLYPFIIHMYMQIFRDSALNSGNINEWIKKIISS